MLGTLTYLAPLLVPLYLFFCVLYHSVMALIRRCCPSYLAEDSTEPASGMRNSSASLQSSTFSSSIDPDTIILFEDVDVRMKLQPTYFYRNECHN